MFKRFLIVVCSLWLLSSCKFKEVDYFFTNPDFYKETVSSFDYYKMRGVVSGSFHGEDVKKYGENMYITVRQVGRNSPDYIPNSVYLHISNDDPNIHLDSLYLAMVAEVVVQGVPFDINVDYSGEVWVVSGSYSDVLEGEGNESKESEVSISGWLKVIKNDEVYRSPVIEGEMSVSYGDDIQIEITDIEFYNFWW